METIPCRRSFLFISSFPRSGSSWFCSMISFLVNKPLEDLDDLGSHFTEPEFSGLNLHLAALTDISLVIKTHTPPLNLERLRLCSPTIYLIRDPRDVCTSYILYKLSYLPTLFNSTQKRYLFKRIFYHLTIAYFLLAKHFDPFGFRRLFIRDFSDKWMCHVSKLSLSPDVLLISYESLIHDTESSLKSVLLFLGVAVDESIIREVISKFQFRKQSNKESSSRLGNVSSFARKGKVGSYRDFLSDYESSVLLCNAVKKYQDVLAYGGLDKFALRN